MPRYILDTEDTTPDPAQLARIRAACHPFELKPQRQTLEIIGRRWFQRTYGNTYHTVSILIDGKLVYKSDRTYGYGDSYLQTAVEWMKGQGLLSENIWGGTRSLREDSGYDFSYSVADVQRQKDL